MLPRRGHRASSFFAQGRGGSSSSSTDGGFRPRPRWWSALSRSAPDEAKLRELHQKGVIDGSFARSPYHGEEHGCYLLLMRGHKPLYVPTWHEIVRSCGLQEMQQMVVEQHWKSLFVYMKEAHSQDPGFCSELDANRFSQGAFFVQQAQQAVSVALPRPSATAPQPPEASPPAASPCASPSSEAGADDSVSLLHGFLSQKRDAPPGMDDVLAIIRGLIPLWVQGSASFAPLLDPTHVDGVAALLPGSVHSSGTLEQHRLALSLEQQILRSCDVIREHCEEVNYSILNSGYSAGVDFARRCLPSSSFALLGGGGSSDGGVWSAVPDVGGGELGDAMRGLKAMRVGCMVRRYVVEDFLTWGLPIIARLFLLGCNSTSSSASQFAECVCKLNAMRRTAVVQDRQGLETYLERLGGVLRHLEAIAQMLTVDEDPDAPRQLAPLGTGGKKADQRKNMAEVSRVVDSRLRQQRGEVVDMLRVLGLKWSSVVNMQGSLHASICYAMETDSSGTNKTRHLFPSEHLPDAVYAPENYLAGSAGEGGGEAFVVASPTQREKRGAGTGLAQRSAKKPTTTGARSSEAAALFASGMGRRRHHDSTANAGGAVAASDAFVAAMEQREDEPPADAVPLVEPDAFVESVMRTPV